MQTEPLSAANIYAREPAAARSSPPRRASTGLCSCAAPSTPTSSSARDAAGASASSRSSMIQPSSGPSSMSSTSHARERHLTRAIPHSSSPTTPHRSTRRNPRHRTRPPKTCSHQVRGVKARLDFLVSYVAKMWVERPVPHFALPLRYHPLRRSRPGWGAIGTERCTRSGTIFLGHPEVRASLQAQWNESSSGGHRAG